MELVQELESRVNLIGGGREEEEVNQEITAEGELGARNYGSSQRAGNTDKSVGEVG